MEDIAGYAHRIVRLKDGRILSDFPTDEDPIHREYVNRAAVAARLAAERTGVVNEPTGAAP